MAICKKVLNLGDTLQGKKDGARFTRNDEMVVAMTNAFLLPCLLVGKDGDCVAPPVPLGNLGNAHRLIRSAGPSVRTAGVSASSTFQGSSDKAILRMGCPDKVFLVHSFPISSLTFLPL